MRTIQHLVRSSTSSPLRGRTRAAVLVPAAVAAATALAGDCGTTPIVPFLLEGQDAPGTGEQFQTFDRPNMGEGGHVAFGGDTNGPIASDEVVYVDDRLVARQGDPANVPGLPDALFGAFEFFETGHQVNLAGELAFITTLSTVPGDQSRAIFHEQVPVAVEGQALEGIPDRLLADVGFVGLTNDGRVGFLADLDGDSGDDSVIVLGDEVLFREGDAAPGLEGATFDGNFDELQWNGAGELLFEGNTSLPGGQDSVVFRRRVVGGSPSVDVVAQEGQAIRASGGADFLDVILQTALAENGDWGLRGNLGIASSDSDAILITGGGFQAQQGDPIPELPGAVLGNFNGIDVNSNGDVLYLADIEGSAPPGVDEGLFLNGCLVITDGVALDGLPDGAVLTDIGFEDLWINDAGQIVFAATYTGGDGLFRLDVGGPVPCPGDLDGDGEVAFEDLTTLLADWGTCDPDPCPADLDGDGEVAFGDLTTLLAAWGPCR